MPPKQKEVKKGPVYKAATPLKDIVPSQIKQPPREPRPLKIPETFPDPPKNNQHLQPVFEQWPAEEVVKAYDFGINSENKYSDTFHQHIKEYMNHPNIIQWKHLSEIKNLQEQFQESDNQKNENNEKQEENESKSLKYVEKSKQNIEANNEEVPMVVIETFMRPQNEQEVEKRLKQQAEKAEKAAKDKKKGKKEQPKQEGPIQVSDVQMSDIIIKKYMTKEAFWIGSQLQIIKQRNLVDVYNGEAVWRKIYPQENGVPKITKSGKYWIKLLHLGKYVKIQIDDRVPVNFNVQELLPLSAKSNQKWTLILAKALIKYLCLVSKDEIVGNGLVSYALTGMISENVSLKAFKQWDKLEDFLSNQHYQKKDIILSCFSANHPKYIVKSSSQPKNQQSEENIAINARKQTAELISPEQEIYQHQDQFQKDKEKETGLINGYSYCIGDYFDNDHFNMVFSQEKSQKQMLLRHEYNELCKISLSNKGREEKLEFRKKKKQLKQKLGVEQKNRLESLSKMSIQYHFIKILSEIKISCEYGEKQILLAKKCVANKLNQPPNYDIPMMDKEEKEMKSVQSMSAIKYKEENQLFPNLDDFSSLANVVELLHRKEPGVWIKDLDFISSFQSIQILYNPNIFLHKNIEDFTSKRVNTYTFDQNRQVLVVEKVEDKEVDQNKIKLLFGFGYKFNDHDTLNTPSTMLQKFDFDSFRTTSNVVTLDKSLSAKLINLKNQNSVFKIYSMSKANYNYWISCDSPYKLTSIADYLTEYQGYTKKTIQVQYPAIQAKTYVPLARIKIKQENQENNTFLIKLMNFKEELMPNLSYKLISVKKDQDISITSQTHEGFLEKVHEKTFLVYEYTRIVIDSGFDYYLVLQAYSHENIPDGNLQLMLLVKNQNLFIECTQQVEPVKYIEKYQPNKYGLICKERIFTNNENNSSMFIKLVEGEEVQGGVGDKKAAKKGGKEESATQILEKPLQDQRNIILRILNGDKILYEAIGVNEIAVPNINLQSTKGNNKEYYLELKFDLALWPEAQFKNQYTQKIFWVVQLSSQDTLALVRDTKQQDREKLTRKSWEDNEPGRAERAKKARRRFLLEIKKQKGESLTQEEEQILNAPRLTKKQQMEEDKKNQQKKGAKGAKKQEKKAGKDAKKQEVIEQKIIQKIPPKSEDNFMIEIKQFLKTLEKSGIQRLKLQEEQQAKIRSEQEIKAIKEGAMMASENRVGKMVRGIEKRETLKIKEKEKKEEIEIYQSQLKNQYKEKFTKYLDWRAAYQEKDKIKQEKQKMLIDVINQEKPTISEADLKKAINQYLEMEGKNEGLANVADLVRKNIKILNLTEKIMSLLPNWEIQELKAIGEEIKKDQIQGIKEEVLKQMKQMLEEAEKNPAIAQEKQAEAKKGKKGGKK